MKAVEPHEVREQLERIRASKGFADSERLRRFLTFTVEAKLQNRSVEVKEYVLGREVFDRNEDYDPRLDPIVRVEARRLRAKLAEYYQTHGRGEQIRLEYPKGTYLPEFRRLETASQHARRRINPLLLVVIAAALVNAVLALTGFAAQPEPAVAVIPGQYLWTEDRAQPAEVVIARELTAELANRDIVPVIAWPEIAANRRIGQPFSKVAADLQASDLYVVSARPVDIGDSVMLFDVDPRTGHKIRALRYVTPVLSFAEQRALARRMADDLEKAKGASASSRR